MTLKDLAIKLATTEKESDIVNILMREGYWNDYRYWRSFGDNDNNFSTIGNQQSKPDTALVEKLVNSVDAILMKECLVRGIDMTSAEAPQSMSEALHTFFGIQEGQISYLDSKARNQMSNSIILAATGNTARMNLTIVDRGEGQTPARMPDTIMSVSKNNKLRVPFVQGKFNMGGTGVLPFCGENRMQLVISRRCPEIPNKDHDPTFNDWSVTIVRRESAREGRRSSMFTYLTDTDGKVFHFSANSLPVIPRPQGEAHEDMFFGTYFKLYDYAIQGYKSNILMDFNYRLSMLMPDLAHPIRLRECREYFKGHSFETTLSGLQTRLVDDRSNNVEPGFPCSEMITIDGQSIPYSIYVFKKGRATNYREDTGVLFTVNGQTHASLSESFFKTSKVNLSYLADSILLLVDCSAIDVSHREDMFMNSRDRLRDGKFSKEVVDNIKETLREHAGLKKLQNERRAAAVQERLNNDKPLQDVLQHILSQSPVLSSILLSGNRLNSPFNTSTSSGTTPEFKGKKHPTFFKIKGKLNDGALNKSVPVGHDFRVQFETDAVNDYFSRPDERGALLLYMDDGVMPVPFRRLGLLNGVATLTISLPSDAKINDCHAFRTEIVDDCIADNFENYIAISVIKEPDSTNNPSGNRTPPSGDSAGNNQSSSAAMPNVQEVYKDDWASYDMNKETALVVRTLDEGSDYFLNMDNEYLLIELKALHDPNRIALTKARYKYSMALLGMSIESYFKNHQSDDEDVDVAEQIKNITEMITPVLIPMLEAMAELNIEDIE